MFSLLLIFISIFSVFSSNPYETGPYLSSLVDINYGNHSTYGDGVGVHIFIVTPKNADKTLPVYFFFTAFAGKVPAPMYRNYFNHVASHGIIVVGMDNKDAEVKPNFQVELASTVLQAIEWLQDGNMVNLFTQNDITTVPDFTKNMLGGHSAGGHTVTQLIKSGCNSITSLVLVDPVDGLSPWGLFKKISEYSSVIHPPAKVTFEIPLLHLDNLMDPLSPFPQQPQYPACAPETLSNDRFFDAWRGPSWQINATYYGHMDIVNGGEINQLNKIFDLFCVGNTTSSNAEYIQLTGGATVAFNQMLYSGDDSYRVYLEDASTMPTEVILKNNNHGYTAPFQPFCTNN
mmetsp:Transcript_19439/g.20159  ORF Transcript_19439/g.20159 Transcript_19439/m.20159 type:complete len:345 (+) Transcript_19439:100-1134(+)